MKVKIGKIVYDSEDTPIMLIFEGDKERKHCGKLITDMPDGSRKLCYYNDKLTAEEIKEFMKL